MEGTIEEASAAFTARNVLKGWIVQGHGASSILASLTMWTNEIAIKDHNVMANKTATSAASLTFYIWCKYSSDVIDAAAKV